MYSMSFVDCSFPLFLCCSHDVSVVLTHQLLNDTVKTTEDFNFYLDCTCYFFSNGEKRHVMWTTQKERRKRTVHKTQEFAEKNNGSKDQKFKNALKKQQSRWYDKKILILT